MSVDIDDMLRTELIHSENTIAEIKDKALYFEGSDLNEIPQKVLNKELGMY